MMETTMPPLELAERLVLLLALVLFFGLAFEEVYKRDQPEIPGGIQLAKKSQKGLNAMTASIERLFGSDSLP